MSAKRLYLAGPMTGLPDYNYPAFRKAAAMLRNEGWTVECPIENDDGSQGKPWQFYLREAIKQVARSEAIALLPGWAKSRGARLELYIALSLGLETYLLTDDELIFTSLKIAREPDYARAGVVVR
jgi:hypothetical protein